MIWSLWQDNEERIFFSYAKSQDKMIDLDISILSYAVMRINTSEFDFNIDIQYFGF